MPANCRRVAVIGTGPSGLTTIRQALQHGHDVCAFEQLDGIGGVWKMAVDPGANRRPVSALSALPVSKELCAFSDFPVPDDFPTFLRPADALAYLQLYAEKFSLNEHIRLGTEVLEVRRASGWERNGKWLLRLHQRHGSGEEVEEEEEFDAVLMCTGMRQKGWRPPEWRLEKQFKGRVLHSEQFTSPADFRDQTVVVVGLGNSAVEIASGLAPIAKQVFLSTRRGGWLLNRLCPSGEPWDRHFQTRFHSECRRWLPKLLRGKLWQWSANRLALLPLTSEGAGQLPAHSLFSSHLTFGADQLGWHLATGRVRLRPDIWSLSADNSVEFVDGSMQHGVDTVLLCTGFQFQFGLVEQGTLLPVRHNDFHLYKHMFAPELAPHHNLAVIGHVQTVGGCVWPVAELQARLFFQVLEEKAVAAVLPSPFWMKAELEKRRCALSVGFLKTRRHTQMEDHVQFCVELAEIFGANPPPFHRLFLSDPRLALAILFGPFCAAQFRIWGPHRQSEAEARNLVLKTAGNGGNNNLLCHWHCPAERSLLLMAIGLLMALFCRILSTVLTQSIT